MNKKIALLLILSIFFISINFVIASSFGYNSNSGTSISYKNVSYNNVTGGTYNDSWINSTIDNKISSSNTTLYQILMNGSFFNTDSSEALWNANYSQFLLNNVSITNTFNAYTLLTTLNNGSYLNYPWNSTNTSYLTNETNWNANYSQFLLNNQSLTNYLESNNASIVNYILTQNNSLVNYIAVVNTSQTNYANFQNTSVTNALATKLGISQWNSTNTSYLLATAWNSTNTSYMTNVTNLSYALLSPTANVYKVFASGAYTPVAEFYAPNNTVAGNANQIRFGISATTGNAAEWRYVHMASNSILNRVDFGWDGYAAAVLSYIRDKVGIGTTYPNETLAVVGNISATNSIFSQGINLTSFAYNQTIPANTYTDTQNTSHTNYDTVQNNSMNNYINNSINVSLNNYILYANTTLMQILNNGSYFNTASGEPNWNANYSQFLLNNQSITNYISSNNASLNNYITNANTTLLQIINNGSYLNTAWNATNTSYATWANVMNGTVALMSNLSSYLLISNWNATNSSYLTTETNWNANYSQFLLNNQSITNYISSNNASLVNYITVQNTSLVNWVTATFSALSGIVGQVGNWSADKVNYYTKTDINNFNSTYLTTYNSTENTSITNSITANNGSVNSYILSNNNSLVNYILTQNNSLVNYNTIQNSSMSNWISNTYNTTRNNYITSLGYVNFGTLANGTLWSWNMNGTLALMSNLSSYAPLAGSLVNFTNNVSVFNNFTVDSGTFSVDSTRNLINMGGNTNVTAGNLSVNGRIQLYITSCGGMVSGEICRNETGVFIQG